MKLKIIRKRELLEFDEEDDEKFVGYVGENRAEKLQFEIPEELQDYAVTINFITDDGNFPDDLEENYTYTLKNNVTKYKRVQFFLEFKKEIAEDIFELKKTAVKTLEFGDSFDVDKEIEEEEIEILDKLIVKIDTATKRANAISEDLEEKVATDYYRGATGPQGIQGIQGEKGDKGDKGDKGEDGKDGGYVAFEIINGHLIAKAKSSSSLEGYSIQNGHLILNMEV